MISEMDQVEFRDIMMQAYPQMRQMALRLLSNNADDAADVIQDATLSLWKNLSSFENASNKVAYAIGTVRMKSLSCISDNHDIITQDTLPDIVGDSEYDDNDNQQYLSTLLSSLPEVQASIVKLNVIQGFSASEIAERLGLSHANVRQLLSRARRTLKTLYTRKDI